MVESTGLGAVCPNAHRADALMLSGETAMGEYPLLAVSSMAKIAKRSEMTIDHNQILKKFIDQDTLEVYDAVGLSVVQLASKIKAKAIFCFTETGTTACHIAKYRPECLIYALSPNKETLFSLALNWGVKPVLTNWLDTLEARDNFIINYAKTLNFKTDDYLVITDGYLEKEATNLLRIKKL